MDEGGGVDLVWCSRMIRLGVSAVKERGVLGQVHGSLGDRREVLVAGPLQVGPGGESGSAGGAFFPAISRTARATTGWGIRRRRAGAGRDEGSAAYGVGSREEVLVGGPGGPGGESGCAGGESTPLLITQIIPHVPAFIRRGA
jgi:hypothetical protein